jgi:hypothetical protein
MLVLHYHNGAMGNTVGALWASCTIEGNTEIPIFNIGKNLHHFTHEKEFYSIKHPHIDIEYEKSKNNTIVCSTSNSVFGKLLILTMSFMKWHMRIPKFNEPCVFNQGNGSYGDQLEMLSDTIISKLDTFDDKYDIIFDILWFWKDTSQIKQFLLNCQLSPIDTKIEEFVKIVTKTNNQYFEIVERCFLIADDVLCGKNYEITVNFFETAIIRALLKMKTTDNLLLMSEPPKYITDFNKLFKENNYGNKTI